MEEECLLLSGPPSLHRVDYAAVAAADSITDIGARVYSQPSLTTDSNSSPGTLQVFCARMEVARLLAS